MKSLFILFLVMVAVNGFSQENPWTPKGQNPWAAYEKNTNTLIFPGDSVSADYKPVAVESKEVCDLGIHEHDSLCAQIEMDVEKKYSSRKDFGIGFAIGAVFGFAGIAGDAIYTIPDSKQEKQIMNEIQADSAYVCLSEKEIKKESKNSLKQKKFGKAIGGTLLAVAIRAAIILGIISTNF